MKTNCQPVIDRKPSAEKAIAAAAIDFLASVKFAVAVIVVIAAACVVGTLLPQGAEAAAYVQKNPAAAERFALFGRLGLTQVFSAWWFIALLCVLATTVMVCSTRRLAAVRSATGFAQRRALGSLLTHLSILLILGGAVVRGVWGEKGWVELREGQTLAGFTSATGPRTLPFAVQLERFDIETYAPAAPAKGVLPRLLVQWTDRQLQARVSAIAGSAHTLTPEGEAPSAGNTFRIEVLKYVPDFSIDSKTREVASRSAEPRNPAILVAVNGPDYHNHRWVFAKFPDFTMHEDGSAGRPSPLRLRYEHDAGEAAVAGPVKSFKSSLNVIENGAVAFARTVEVNRPLRYKGYTFYQTGYNPDDLSWTSLEVVRDPGVPLVYAGFVLLIGGLFVVFYLNPWLAGREARA